MRKKVLWMVGIILSCLMTFTTVNAAVVEAGEKIDLEGNYSSSKFIFGDEVNTYASIDGLTLIGSNNVTTEGEVEYGLYAANLIYINDKVKKDLFVAGDNVNIGNDAVISRDVYIAARTVKINSEIGRNMKIVSETLDISGVTIKGNVYALTGKIIMDENTRIEGKLTYNESTEFEGKGEAFIADTKILKNEESDDSESGFGTTLLLKLFQAISAFIVLIIFIALAPMSAKKLDKKEMGVGALAKDGLKGLTVIVVVPILALLALISSVFSSIGVLLFILYGVAIYFSKLLTAYLIGRGLLGLGKKENKYISALLGVLIVYLLSLIPHAGFVFTIVFILIGLGITYNLIFDKKA